MTVTRISKIKLSFLFGFLFGVCLVMPVEATVLYLEPSEIHVGQGEIFIIDIKIDTEGECINAIEGSLSFSRDTLRLVDFSTGSSILSLWAKPPEINQDVGTLNFIGGIPGGYCGEIKGDIGPSNIIGKMIFRSSAEVISLNPTYIKFLPGTQVLLNDGLGTPAKLISKGAEIIISTEKKAEKDHWQEKLKADKIPPEAFKVEITQDPSMFDGKYFIVFSTTDKQSGIDHYEVRETPQKFSWKTGKWIKISNSPYLLQDQTLSSIIEVKAVDKAGNERLEKITPVYKRTFKDWLPVIIIFILGILGMILRWILKKRSTDSR